MFSLTETNFVSDSIEFICKFVVAKKKKEILFLIFFALKKKGRKRVMVE